jgi:uracil-DNA glycosylase
MTDAALAQLSRSEALAMLRWLIAVGADEATGSVSMDRFAEAGGQPHGPQLLAPAPMRPPPGPPVPAPMRLPPGPPVPAPRPAAALGGSAGDAIALAAACSSFAEIAAALAAFDACPLKRTATKLVYLDGHPDARLLFIGEAPGREEDLSGRPFVGRSGQLLDRMLQAIGLSRHGETPENSVYISNVIFWRPPGNRTPTDQETLMCLPFLRRAIEIKQPRLLVCLGATPTQRLIGRSEGILKLRGRWFDFASGQGSIPLLATLHPAYLLRQPAQKRLAWRDFLSLKQKAQA